LLSLPHKKRYGTNVAETCFGETFVTLVTQRFAPCNACIIHKTEACFDTDCPDLLRSNAGWVLMQT